MTGVLSGALFMCACSLPVHATSTTNWAFLSLSAVNRQPADGVARCLQSSIDIEANYRQIVNTNLSDREECERSDGICRG